MPSGGDNSKLPGMGGAYNSFNLGLYTYSHFNPVRYTDPDGKFALVEFGIGAIITYLVIVAIVNSKPTKYGANSNSDESLGGATNSTSGGDSRKSVNQASALVSAAASPSSPPPDDDGDRPRNSAEKSDSGKLRSNMENAGQQFRAGEDAHHMVPGEMRAAAPAREVLKKFGIGLNSAENGVALTGSRAGSIKDFFSLTHRGSGLHSEASIRSVNQQLGSATTRQEAVEVLNAIRQDILSGKLP